MKFHEAPDDQSFIHCANINCSLISISNCTRALGATVRMFTPRFASSLGAAGSKNRVSQFLRQQRLQATRPCKSMNGNHISCRAQQQRWQSTRGFPKIDRSKGAFSRNVKILFKAHPYSMTGATIWYFTPSYPFYYLKVQC